MLALFSSSHSPRERISLQEAANRKIVDLSSKGDYCGDSVSFLFKNIQHPDVEIAVVAGDMLLNKNRNNQDLVLGKLTGPLERIKKGTFNGQQAYIISVPAGEQMIAEGGYTFCVDGHKSSPNRGDKFDVAPNLRDFNSHLIVSRLLSLVQLADERNLYDKETSQEAVWFYTNPDKHGHPDNSIVKHLIEDSGGDPKTPKSGFLHLSNPNADSPDTGAVIPPEVNPINLSWQEPSRVLTISFVSPKLNLRQFCITVPQDANLNVAVMNISGGNIWEATIYEKTDEHGEFRDSTIGDGSTTHYSKAAKVEIASGIALLVIRYKEGADIWPARMSVKLWIDD